MIALFASRIAQQLGGCGGAHRHHLAGRLHAAARRR
jgi:hypothetical protein